MSDTPRTDAVEIFLEGNPKAAFVPSYFSRTLERELAAVTAERDNARHDRDNLSEEYGKYSYEIARLKRDLALAGLSLKTWVSSFDDMTSKRDDLAAKLAQAKNALLVSIAYTLLIAFIGTKLGRLLEQRQRHRGRNPNSAEILEGQSGDEQ